MKRRILLSLWVISLIAFVCLSVNVLNGNTQGFNNEVYYIVEKFISPFMTKLMVFISNIGEWYIYFAIILICILIPKTTTSVGVPLALTISMSALLNSILKNIFVVSRPEIRRLIEISGYGYPSGHAMNGAVFFGLCAYLFTGLFIKKTYKAVLCVFSGTIVFLIGFSRIYLGVHTASDVLGGYLAGVFIIISADFIIEKVKKESMSISPRGTV